MQWLRVGIRCQLASWRCLSSQIVLDDDTVARHQLTTEEIREYCADVKVLGKQALKYDLKCCLVSAEFVTAFAMLLTH